ncbi:MAG: hypothetical protein LQ338_006274 [Usnochroma carphineum]|nr:MAG: hypothetical protein LQ338_006274 [Usnochroma carphineum]
MAPQFPSIQSFFRPGTTGMPRPVNVSKVAGDSSTSNEVDARIPSTLHPWEPRDRYEEVQISNLDPGSRYIHLLARIANLNEPPTPSKMPNAAKGCLKLLLRDDSGTIMVRLWYAKVEYQLRLGQLVSLWTTHVSHLEPGEHTTAQTAAYATTIFPERDNRCYVMVQEDSTEGQRFNTPLGYSSDKQLPGLLTLQSFINGGHEVPNAKVLVCVKSIGGRKKFTTKQGHSLDCVNVNVFDDTNDAMLSLCGRVAKSAAYWKTSHTILLLSSPGFRGEGRGEKKPVLCVNWNTYVDVDPAMTDAQWLRRFAQRLTTREAVNIHFPQGVFDVHAAMYADDRVLFTLAEIDE